jgi:diguanylate cyclase (GGDEF)-like protein
VLRYVERTQECLLVDDALSDDRFAGESRWAGMSYCSLLVVPILNQGRLHSMLVLQNRLQRAAFSRDRLDAVMLIAGQLSVSLENALLYASLERKVADRTSALEEANLRLALLSQTDALTGLANRRHFDQVLEVECLRAKRTGTSIGLVMIDVDHFKQYNDHYGHQGGDACLRIVASALKASMRNSADLIARYGGEEFVLLLPNADLAGAHAAAERVRAAVEAMQEPHAGAARNIVTISAGFSTFSPIEGDNASDCLREADAALYAAKRDGRNCAQGPEVDEPQDATWSVSYAG